MVLRCARHCVGAGPVQSDHRVGEGEEEGPTVLILVEAQSRMGHEEPPRSWTTHAVSSFPLMARRGPVLTCMSARGQPPDQLWGHADTNALLMEVLTPWGRHHVLAAQINIGYEPYVQWWAEI